MELFVAELFTGARTFGVYATQQEAQQAVQNHFAVMGVGAGYNPHAWYPISDVVLCYLDPQKDTNGYIDSVYITKVTVGDAIPLA